ncbi:AAA family ATPase [Telluria mixta]|uniref:AAA family ATPase n=1 Tax=Telluria mixta TaxID=34071 RepID=A0ABT2C5U7_9BURK|nr:AAA family ATPase [Telluria mixta]MCS0632770.1 AAA family ATPase [Telluria mixta]WEM97847.1 AAA family ATPase [Telluria mixta]
MRLRYLHLRNYPPISDIKLCFASGSPLARECAIRFVVGVNGSGKSNLLRALSEVFLALADGRPIPFPVQLVYELGHRDSPSSRTLVLDGLEGRQSASLWIAERYVFPDDATAEHFEQALFCISTDSSEIPTEFRPLIRKGQWPSASVTPQVIALPSAVLAYTTGDPRPWRSVWSRNQQADGLLEAGDDTQGDERPAGWTVAQEYALQAARQAGLELARPTKNGTSLEINTFRRPLLLDATLLKCALLVVTLPQSFVEATDYRERTEVDSTMTNLRCRDNNKNTLQELLERGGWHHLVSIAFRSRLQTAQWDQKLCETAHDWWLCASEVITEPHPVERRRTLLFDLNGTFDAQNISFVSSVRDELQTCGSHGEALWALLGGAKDASAFDLFIRLLELHQMGLFDDVLLRLRRHAKPEASTGAAQRDIGVLRYEELSDGEQMFMGRMALLHLLSGRQDSLLLLDEPETHFNDLWKRDVVSVVDDALAHTTADVLIATHAALMLTDALKDELVVLERKSPKGDAGPEESGIRTLDAQTYTFGATGDHPLRDVFGAPDTVGKRASRLLEVLIAMSQFPSEMDAHWRDRSPLSDQLIDCVLDVALLTEKDLTRSQVQECLVSFEHFAVHFGAEQPLTVKSILETFIRQTGPGYFQVELKRAWRRLMEGTVHAP